MANFPVSTPSFAGFTASHTLSQDNHAAQHTLEQGEIVALSNKIGTGASTPTSGTVLRGNGAGTSIWGDVDLTTDVTGILGTSNGGTGTTSTTGTGANVYQTSPSLTTPSLTSPTISNPTITAGGSWSGSPSITTPTIASFANSNHTHANSAGGGALSINTNFATIIYPYKFNAYKSSAQTPNAVPIIYNVENFDTDSDFDTTTGRYTIPVSGFYQFNVVATYTVTAAPQDPQVQLVKNGATVLATSHFVHMYNGTTNATNTLSSFEQLTAGDYVECYGVNLALNVTSQDFNKFSGFFVSHT